MRLPLFGETAPSLPRKLKFQKLNLPATIICGALLDRLYSDQHNDGPVKIKEYSNRPQDVVLVYLKKMFLLDR